MDGDNPQVLRLLLFLTTDIPRSFSEITYHLELTKDDAVALLACGTELGALYSINGHWIIRNTASVKCVMMFLKSRPTIKGCKLKTLRSTRLDEFMSPEFLESKRRKEKQIVKARAEHAKWKRKMGEREWEITKKTRPKAYNVNKKAYHGIANPNKKLQEELANLRRLQKEDSPGVNDFDRAAMK